MARMAAEANLESEKFIRELNEKRVARGALPIEQARAERAKEGHPLVQLVEREGWDDVGFMLFRMDYSDDERWERFREGLDVILEKSMDSRDPEEGVDRLEEKLFTKFVDDDTIDGTGPMGVSRFARRPRSVRRLC